MQNQLKGKVVAITGASSGIGKAIAIALAKQEARLVLGARRTDQLEELVQEVKQHGGNAVFAKTDVKNREDVARLVDLSIATYGRLDVIVNNAGIAAISRIDELDVEAWDEMIDVNIKGVLYMIASAIPVFQKQESGHIINIISTSGLKIVPMQAVYAGTKNAIRTISEAFRQESDGKIRITGISPGYVKTDFASKSVKSESMKEMLSKHVDKMAISPDAVADAVIYAMSQPSDVEIGDIVIRPSVQD